MREENEEKAVIIVAGALLAIIGICAIGWWVFSSSMEAKAYNRLTGAHATTWDAMWVELRVQERPKE